MLSNINKRFFFIFIIATLFILFFWFKEGKIIAGGEEGLQLWNPSRTFQLYSSVWIDVGTGLLSPLYLPRLTYFGLNSILSWIFAPWLSQAIGHFFLIMAAFLGFYYFTREVLNTSGIKIPLIASLFYAFNLYTQSQIWGRGLATGFFAWSYLPIFLLIWMKWVKTGQKIWILALILASLLFSYTFGAPANVFTFAVPLVIWLLLFIFRNVKSEQLTLYLGRILLIGLIWIISNIWWIYPYYAVLNESYSEFLSWERNMIAFQMVSSYFPTEEIILLRQYYLFQTNDEWKQFYDHPSSYFISILIFIIVIISWVATRRKTYSRYLTILLFVGWFISKGTNPPYGLEFFQWITTSISQTAVLRNPYEKFGLVWLIPYSIFFALGVGYIYKSNSWIRQLTSILIILISCLVLVWPFWSGDIFSKTKITVPYYYDEANRFMGKDGNFRLLIMPLKLGQGTSFSWGYDGIEPTEFLFDRPAISKSGIDKYHNQILTDTLNAFTKNIDITNLLKQMNVKYIVLHHDMKKMDDRDAAIAAEKYLNSNSSIVFIKQVGELSIYQVKNFTDDFFDVEGAASVVSYMKVSSTHYLVKVSAKGPYKLIFKESYGDRWKLYMNREEVKDHELIYNFANLWKINKLGDYEMELKLKLWPWE